MSANALEEEFFRVEGKPTGNVEACRYIVGLHLAPNGEAITSLERAALWYLAFFSHQSYTHPSVPALAAHLDIEPRMARHLLQALINKGIVEHKGWETFPTEVWKLQFTGTMA